MIRGVEEFNRSDAKDVSGFANRNEAGHPVQQRVLRPFLRDDIHDGKAVYRVLDERGIEFIGFRGGESSVPASGPLHRGSNAVAVAEIDVVAHADFVAVVDARRTGE